MENVCCNVNEFEKQALQILDRDVADYYQGGATTEETLRNNRKAFTKLRIRPHVMRNVKERDSSLTILGKKHRCPVGISPTAMQKLAHCEGEVATAKAAAAMDAVMILSILSTTSLEEVARENPKATLWQQVYIFKERNLTLDLIKRAEDAGYKAIVLTMDTAVLGSRYRDLKNKFTMPPYLTLENFRNVKQYNEDLSIFNKNPGQCSTGLTDYISTQFDDSVSWDDVKSLVSSTNLPIICKGILTGPDALNCFQAGAKGIIVSNHGGRQLDHTPATIEALPEVVKAVGNLIEVYMDGGIRNGTDIFKAIGLGAKYVFVGRAALYGLTHSGFNGVLKVLQILNFEFDQTMALCGCTSAEDISGNMIVHKRYYENLLMSNLQNVSSEPSKPSPFENQKQKIPPTIEPAGSQKQTINILKNKSRTCKTWKYNPRKERCQSRIKAQSKSSEIFYNTKFSISDSQCYKKQISKKQFVELSSQNSFEEKSPKKYGEVTQKGSHVNEHTSKKYFDAKSLKQYNKKPTSNETSEQETPKKYYKEQETRIKHDTQTPNRYCEEQAPKKQYEENPASYEYLKPKKNCEEQKRSEETNPKKEVTDATQNKNSKCKNFFQFKSVREDRKKEVKGPPKKYSFFYNKKIERFKPTNSQKKSDHQKIAPIQKEDISDGASSKRSNLSSKNKICVKKECTQRKVTIKSPTPIDSNSEFTNVPSESLDSNDDNPYIKQYINDIIDICRSQKTFDPRDKGAINSKNNQKETLKNEIFITSKGMPRKGKSKYF